MYEVFHSEKNLIYAQFQFLIDSSGWKERKKKYKCIFDAFAKLHCQDVIGIRQVINTFFNTFFF